MNNNTLKMNLELMEQFEADLARRDRQKQADNAKANKAAWDEVVNATTTKQYFTWHNLYFKGNLSYRHMAESMKKSTKSQAIHQKCDILLNLLTKQGL